MLLPFCDDLISMNDENAISTCARRPFLSFHEKVCSERRFSFMLHKAIHSGFTDLSVSLHLIITLAQNGVSLIMRLKIETQGLKDFWYPLKT